MPNVTQMRELHRIEYFFIFAVTTQNQTMNLLRLYLTTFLFLSFISLTQAQKTVSISGEAIDELTEMPVESATVYLSLAKDSTLVDYSSTGKEGQFKLTLKRIDEPVFFSISDDFAGEFRQDFDHLTEDIDLGRIKLRETISLEGIVISGSPPIRVKTDTLEFNAASFKVRPDANVESLLKELPGVEIDEDGKIMVNGKEVNQILVNGKPFFDKDGKIALENLPADLIKKVQITDTKTKKEEITGRASSSNNASINLTIDEDKNKGIMLKAMAGYGTKDRYESSLMLNHFKGNSKLSILASSNNINSVGFSMNEIFDNMGSSRSRTMFSSSDGSFGVNGMRFGGGRGITQSHLGGLTYANSFSNDIEMNSNYFYTQTETKNQSFTRQENLLPQHVYTTESRSKTNNRTYNHNFSNSFEYKIDSTSTLWLEPKYSYNKTLFQEEFDRFTVNESGDLLNESQGKTNKETLVQNFSNTISYYKKFQNKTQLSLSFSNENQKNNVDELQISNTAFHQNQDPDDIRNQNIRRKDVKDKYNFELEYEFSLTDSLFLGVGTDYEIRKDQQVLTTWDFDELTGNYDLKNHWISSDIATDFNKLSPYLSMRWQKKNFRLGANMGIHWMKQENNGNYLAQNYQLTQEKTTPSLNLNANFKMGQSANLYINYDMREQFATAEQLLPIQNLSNPLTTTIGNPDLKTTKEHSLYAGFYNYNMQSKTNINVYMGGSYFERNVVARRTTDENYKNYITYQNVEGNYSVWSGASLNKSFTSGRHKFRVGLGLNFSHGYNQGFIDGQKYDAKSYTFRPRINFNWDIDKIITINPSYNLQYQWTNYHNFSIDKRQNLQHVFKVATTNYWPKNFVFGNDFSYTYNSNIANGFNKDFFLWNTSLAYNFYQDQLTLKVKVYDLLGQNTGDSRSISETAITDTQNDVLKRYVMFSLGFKLDQFGGKKKARGSRFMVLD